MSRWQSIDYVWDKGKEAVISDMDFDDEMVDNWRRHWPSFYNPNRWFIVLDEPNVIVIAFDNGMDFGRISFVRRVDEE